MVISTAARRRRSSVPQHTNTLTVHLGHKSRVSTFTRAKNHSRFIWPNNITIVQRIYPRTIKIRILPFGFDSFSRHPSRSPTSQTKAVTAHTSIPEDIERIYTVQLALFYVRTYIFPASRICMQCFQETGDRRTIPLNGLPKPVRIGNKRLRCRRRTCAEVALCRHRIALKLLVKRFTRLKGVKLPGSLLNPPSLRQSASSGLVVRLHGRIVLGYWRSNSYHQTYKVRKLGIVLYCRSYSSQTLVQHTIQLPSRPCALGINQPGPLIQKSGDTGSTCNATRIRSYSVKPYL